MTQPKLDGDPMTFDPDARFHFQLCQEIWPGPHENLCGPLRTPWTEVPYVSQLPSTGPLCNQVMVETVVMVCYMMMAAIMSWQSWLSLAVKFVNGLSLLAGHDLCCEPIDLHQLHRHKSTYGHRAEETATTMSASGEEHHDAPHWAVAMMMKRMRQVIWMSQWNVGLSPFSSE